MVEYETVYRCVERKGTDSWCTSGILDWTSRWYITAETKEEAWECARARRSSLADCFTQVSSVDVVDVPRQLLQKYN